MYTVSAEQHERSIMEAHQKYVMDYGYMTRIAYLKCGAIGQKASNL